MATSHAVLGVLLALVAAAVAGRVKPAWAAWAGAAAAAACAVLLAFTRHGAALDVAWIGALGSRARLALDGLGQPLAVFTAAIAAPILAYTAAYLPAHLRERDARAEERGRDLARFSRLLLGFLAAMLLLLLAQDLLVLFVALELTALASFLLIEFDGHREARRAATLALMVTAGSSLAFLAGLVWIATATGTTVLSELEGAGAPRAAVVLLAAGVLAKSAQFPLHVWLPRAMVAPTPVSAYLHSASMVTAGVFVLMRLRFLLEDVPALLGALVAVGCVSIAAGGTLALVSGRLKRILAYSTIAQLGYVLVLLAAGGPAGLAGAPLAIVAHGTCKAALFLTAGAVTRATGAHELGAAAGSLRRMPALAAASGVAAAGLAGLPLTAGYWKDEVLFAAAHSAGPVASVAAGAAAALALLYAARFWLGLLGAWRVDGDGGARDRRESAPFGLVAPVVLLAAAVLAGGAWTHAYAEPFRAAGGVVAGGPGAERGAMVELRLHAPLSLRPETAIAACAWTAAALAFALRRRWEPALRRAVDRASGLGPAAGADRLEARTRRASHALHRLELRDLRDRLAAVVAPTALLVGAGLAAHGLPALHASLPAADRLPAAGALLVVVAGAVGAARARDHVALVLLLSFAGFGLALAFALNGAPDVALVVVLVETTATLLFLALLARLRGGSLARQHGEDRHRLPWAGLVAGATGFLLAWCALGSPREESVARRLVELADTAHGKDVVTVALADFRGMDTSVEITVLAVAFLGAAGVAWGRDEE